MTLDKSTKNITYLIKSINAPDEKTQKRFFQLGFNLGKKLTLKRKAPFFGDPLLFEIAESQVALTKVEASYIEIIEE